MKPTDKPIPKQKNKNSTLGEQIAYYEKRITNLRIQKERFIRGVEVLEKLKQEVIDDKEKE